MFELNSNKEIIRRYRELHNTNMLHMLNLVMAEDAICHNLLPGQPDGLEGARASHQVAIDSFPDMVTVSLQMVAEGNLVVERWQRCGRHTGQSFLGIPPSGKRINISGITIFRLDEGKIVEYWAEYNEMEVLRQLGQPVMVR